MSETFAGFLVGALGLVLLGVAVLVWRSLGARGGDDGGRAEQAVRDEMRAVREELRAARTEAGEAARAQRGELGGTLKAVGDTLTKTLLETGGAQRAQLDALRGTVEERLDRIREGNEKKLEEMRQTVDQKLHDALEKRLGESFRLVSERLEAVHKGLGEMQTLASGVGDLKRVLTNVKTRGTWGEIQLGALLEEILVPGQYERNVRTRADAREAVEFAVRLPGPDGADGDCVWLPIDSKFPQEDYHRLQEAAEAADGDGVQKAAAALGRAVRLSAQTIHDKYINPPRTTDFALLFLPTEGLYAEVLRQPGLVEQIRRESRVEVAGPTTLAAFLNSLRMGFRTLALQERATEVWKILGAVKGEFEKFGEVLGKVHRQIQAAANTIEETQTRARAMGRRLRDVERLPGEAAAEVLGLPPAGTAAGNAAAAGNVAAAGSAEDATAGAAGIAGDAARLPLDDDLFPEDDQGRA
jgi:DNA recombination protein RmuC